MLEIETHIGQIVPDEKEAALVNASGRIDRSNAHEIGDELDFLFDEGIFNVTLSLVNTEYLSSSGLREIVRVWKKMRRNKGDIQLELTKDNRAHEVFILAGLDTIFELKFQPEDSQS